MKYEFGVAFAPARGEVICGDGCAVVEQSDDWWVCVVDGLGHGPLAADAARATTDFVRQNPDRDIARMLQRLDAILKPTRGAAVSLLHCERATGAVHFSGVGNVELRTQTRVPFSPITMPGIVGRGIRKTLVLHHQLSAGDLLVLATDGLSSRMDFRRHGDGPTRAIAEGLVSEYHRAHDDALCVSIRVAQGLP